MKSKVKLTPCLAKQPFLTGSLVIGSIFGLLLLCSIFIHAHQKSLAHRRAILHSQASLPTSFLSIQPKTATSAAIILDTGKKQVTAVQLELAFDSRALSRITVTSGSLLHNARVVLQNTNSAGGTLFYAAMLSPQAQPITGKGEIAVISYDFNKGTITPTMLHFLPRTKVAAKGIDASILKQATGIIVAPH